MKPFDYISLAEHYSALLSNKYLTSDELDIFESELNEFEGKYLEEVDWLLDNKAKCKRLAYIFKDKSKYVL